MATAESAVVHPLVAVVDTQNGESTSGRTPVSVVWHIQTDPMAPTEGLTGAWIISEGYLPDNDREEASIMDTLRSGAVIVTTYAQVESLYAAVSKECEVLREKFACASREAKDRGESLAGWRSLDFPPIVVRDPAELRAEYRGEPVARDCWVLAHLVSEVVGLWHEVESVRIRRRHLREGPWGCGTAIRPFPIPEELPVEIAVL